MSGCRPRHGISTFMPVISRMRGRTPTGESKLASANEKGDGVRWNLRMAAAERGIWKSTEMRHRLAEAGLEISAGKMSRWWTTTPVSLRLDDLDVICAVLECTPKDLLICEPDKVAVHKPVAAEVGAKLGIVPRLGRHRSAPPA